MAGAIAAKASSPAGAASLSISVVGLGYVGAVSMACLATLGHRIIISPSARVKNITAKEIVEQSLERVSVPGARARNDAPAPAASNQPAGR